MSTGPRMVQRTRGATGADNGISFGEGLWLFENAGAPSSGTSGTGAGWAGKGSLCVDSTNGALYQNTNTKASPTWTSR